jgi:hypothetical protein
MLVLLQVAGWVWASVRFPQSASNERLRLDFVGGLPGEGGRVCASHSVPLPVSSESIWRESVCLSGGGSPNLGGVLKLSCWLRASPAIRVHPSNFEPIWILGHGHQATLPLNQGFIGTKTARTIGHCNSHFPAIHGNPLQVHRTQRAHTRNTKRHGILTLLSFPHTSCHSCIHHNAA